MLKRLLLAILLPLVAFATPDFNKPSNATNYATYSTEIRDNVIACVQLDPTSAANIPTGAIWFDYANGLFKRYQSSTWVTKNLSIVDADVNSSAGISGTKLADDGITFSKIQNISTDTLIGRDTASTGDPEAISVSGGLEFSGSSGIRRSALTGDVTASAGSNSTTISNDSVTSLKLGDTSMSLVAQLGSTTFGSSTSSRFLTINSDQDPATSSLTGVTRIVLPRAFKIVAISCSAQGPSFTVTIYKNGSSTGQSLSGCGTTSGSVSVTYAANDYLDVEIVASSAPISSDISVLVWGRPQ